MDRWKNWSLLILPLCKDWAYASFLILVVSFPVCQMLLLGFLLIFPFFFYLFFSLRPCVLSISPFSLIFYYTYDASTSLCLFQTVSSFLSLYISIKQSANLCLYLSIHLSTNYLSTSLCFSQLSIPPLAACTLLSFFLYRSFYLSLYIRIYLCIYLSTCLLS